MVKKPNYTQIPNEFLDDRMASLSYWGFKVLMAISRKTFGFHKQEEHISFSQLRSITGIPSNDTLYKAIEELASDVEKYTHNGKTYYRILFENDMGDYYTVRNSNNNGVTPGVTQGVTPGVNTKERVKQTSLKKDTAIAVSDTTLYAPLQQAFLSKNDGKFSNYGKEGKAIHAIIAKARDRMPEDPASLIKSMLEAFWRLKTADTSANGFWRSQPFLPSSLSALWDRVLETMRNDEVDPEVMKIINGGGA